MASHRAHLFTKPGSPLELTTLPTPTPTTGQVLVSVLSAPILHYSAESHAENGALSMAPLPIVPGVGAIGRVLSVGSPTSTSHEPGQLVLCDAFIRARDDPSGRTAIIQGLFPGITPAAQKLMKDEWRHSSWQEKMLVPVENAKVLDETHLRKNLGYSLEQLAWINHMLVPYGGLDRAELQAGETVIVAPATAHFSGCAVLVALAMGAGRVVALGRNVEALANLSNYDPSGRIMTVKLTGDAAKDNEAILAATPGGNGAEVFIDLSPSAAKGSTHFTACFGALKPAGRAVLVGGVLDDININYGLFMVKSLRLLGQFMYSSAQVAKVVALVESGVLDLRKLKATSFEFDRLSDGIEAAKGFNRLGDLAVLTLNQE
ncbi:MAG: hypothetical protein M1833_006370 [Piccolia ochrophora]|nr:MAG: hypothetical protein M1833_006370 [Piccolia ochrophora]